MNLDPSDFSSQSSPKPQPGLCQNLVAVLENPTFIINIGHVIRNVNGLGVEWLYVVDPDHRLEDDPMQLKNRKSLLKHSSAAVKWTQIRRFDTSEDCFEYLEREGFESLVTSPHQKGKNNTVLHEGTYLQPKLAVWFGNESKGISDLAIARSSGCIQIGMYGQVESLNLATTTGIVLHEVTRQRREKLA
ncbi:TrmH family RNA methyltransferase [Pontibacter sp. G13]|uniref:TrmH family RNA methyltransferase n=1 Tax=Pontibacter sp. G13 TaxID=3074898 RepID=UPI00288B2FE5|nr:TrmH family RNA methyltransferase [Pontibacter sp. G13]WNJ18311.1 TrmH family RNA methyltransferase [Pontibacter sp. G13]